MKKTIATTVVAGVTALGLTAVAFPVTANAATCASAKNYRQVKNGMTVDQVARILGSKGKVTINLSSLRMVTRDYRTCTSFSSVSVTFTNGRVSDKLGFFF